jgi:hypothetical protein
MVEPMLRHCSPGESWMMLDDQVRQRLGRTKQDEACLLVLGVVKDSVGMIDAS